MCTGGACATSCTPSTAGASCDTAAGYHCIDGLCQKKHNGGTCNSNADCATGRCVDGVCCASPSCPDCESCNVSGHEGVCYAVPAGTADGACAAQCPAGSNQMSGLCDGNGACRPASDCPNGALCSNNQCATDCSGVGCTAGYFCVGSACTATKPDGSICAADGECTHGHCLSDGTRKICCATTCTDTVCASTALCASSGAACQTYAEGSPCTVGSPTCSPDGHAQLAGTGTCSAGNCQPLSTSCQTGYMCVSNACVVPGACTPTSGCDAVLGYACNAGSGNCEPL
jgi:hypothetical protein